MELPRCSFSIFALPENILLVWSKNISKKEMIKFWIILPSPWFDPRNYTYPSLEYGCLIASFFWWKQLFSNNIEIVKGRILNMKVVEDWRSSSRLNGRSVHLARISIQYEFSHHRSKALRIMWNSMYIIQQKEEQIVSHLQILKDITIFTAWFSGERGGRGGTRRMISLH